MRIWLPWTVFVLTTAIAYPCSISYIRKLWQKRPAAESNLFAFERNGRVGFINPELLRPSTLGLSKASRTSLMASPELITKDSSTEPGGPRRRRVVKDFYRALKIYFPVSHLPAFGV